MASPRRRARRKPGRKAAGRTPWWGEGPAPEERWPGATLAIPARWHHGRKRWESHAGRYYFDAEAAAQFCDFFPTFLRHHKGEFANQPFTLLDYQRIVLRTVFGWKRAADGLRRFRKVLVAVPKGNGKSPFGAGTALALLLCDKEDGAEVYSAAADREQAAIVFDTARVMVEADKDLSELCEVFRRAIVVPGTRSSYKVLSADASTKHGFNVHGLVFDEFHAQRDRTLFEALHRGMVKRRQPLLLMVTTAGDDEESICYEEWEYARRVQSGSIEDESYLPMIFEASPEDDWKDPELWARVNPGLGVTVKRDALEAECRAAAAEPRKLNDFMRYHLNRWVNQAVAWIPVDWWDACEAPPAFEPGLVVGCGLDLAQKIDLASFAVVVRHPREDPVEAEVSEGEPGTPQVRTLSLNFDVSLFVHFWCPEDTMREREHDDGVPYSLWAQRGLVTPTPGTMIDFNRILHDVTKVLLPRFGLAGRRCGYDPAFASDLAPRLAQSGLVMVETLQNYQHLNEASQAFYALVKAGRVRHGSARTSHPLRWCVENVAVRQDDAGRIRPVKPRRSNKRIDGVVAAIMGVDQLLREPPPAPPQSYRVDWVG